MSSALLWFGALGAPIAWALQLTINYSFEEWFACAPSTTEPGRVLGVEVPTLAVAVSLVLGAVAVAAGVAAFSCHRKLSAAVSDEVTTRALWMARAGIMNTALYLIIIVASFGPPLLLDVCEVSP